MGAVIAVTSEPGQPKPDSQPSVHHPGFAFHSGRSLLGQVTSRRAGGVGGVPADYRGSLTRTACSTRSTIFPIDKHLHEGQC